MCTKTNLGLLTTLALTLGPSCGSTSEPDANDTNETQPAGEDTGLESSSSSGGEGSTSTAGADATSSGEDGDPVTPPPVVWDLGTVPDAPFDVEAGCQAVDFLFVIDNSGSMGSSQTNLVNNFPTFIEGIQSTLTDVQSYHVGVITTDDYQYNEAGCTQLGALVTQTGGSDSSNATCGPFADGHRFMTEADDLDQTFSCAAQVGTVGDYLELPMDGLAVVMSRALDSSGGCNEDFLRDEALLVAVVITDEEDGPGDFETPTSAGTPMTWYDGVIAAKGGIPENAAVLALVSSSFGSGDNFIEFTEYFGENGFWADIGEPDYGPVFAEAVSIIENACDNFIPPG